VGLLDSFEERLDRLVNGAFARAFKSEVQPVEIAAAVQSEMDESAAVAPDGRTVVPNHFGVDLSPHDFDRLGAYAKVLTGELSLDDAIKRAQQDVDQAVANGGKAPAPAATAAATMAATAAK